MEVFKPDIRRHLYLLVIWVYHPRPQPGSHGIGEVEQFAWLKHVGGVDCAGGSRADDVRLSEQSGGRHDKRMSSCR